MFKFFKKKRKEVTVTNGFAGLYADMHAHFIPGIDDGPGELEQSLELIRGMSELGYRKLVTTPHINADFFPNTTERISQAVEALKAAVSAAGIPIEIGAAAEYMIDLGFMDLLQQDRPFLTLGNTSHVLVEMGYVQVAPMLDDALFRLQAKGYVPVLAHPERYVFYHDAPMSVFEELKGKGCLFQLNMIAFSGYYGKSVQLAAEKLFHAGLYDYCGSDIHHERHLRALKSLLNAKIYPKLIHYNFLNSAL